MTQQRLVISMGDPSGIGPEIIVKALKQQKQISQISYEIHGWIPVFEGLRGFKALLKRDDVSFVSLDVKAKSLSPKLCGQLSVLALQSAVDRIRSSDCISALVTAPIHKGHIDKAGFGFPGHTEFLADEFGIKNFAMMLFHDRLKVVLSTIHIPLSQVSKTISSKIIEERLALTSQALLDWFGEKKPRLAVCGLNPHASEGGLFGNEEKLKITPGIQKFRKTSLGKKVLINGPLPGDTVFHRAIEGEFDAVICQYHDQGLIPLKTTGFYDGVNLTLGLPFVRTSPDHGTAIDIAGQNKANPQSMIAAIKAALKLSKRASRK